MSRYKLAFDHNNMIPAPAGVATVQRIWETEDGIMVAWGTTVPTDATAGYAPGCLFIHSDGGSGTALYINEGTATSCNFDAVPTSGSIKTVVAAGDIIDDIEATELSGTAAGRGPSPLIWDTCPVLEYTLDPTEGFHYFNDFIGENIVLAANQTVTNLGGGVSGFTAATAGTTISMLADEPTGVVALNSTTDNEDSGICIFGGLNTAAQIKFTAGKKFWFEVRMKCLNTTDSKFGVFCGFAEEGLNATTALIAADDTLTDKDLVGFFKVSADGDKFDTVHNTASGGGVTTLKADAVTIAADTYLKLGGYCDGTTLTFYANGVALADTVAIAATNFPDGEEMAFYLVGMNTGGDTHEVAIDWIRIAIDF